MALWNLLESTKHYVDIISWTDGKLPIKVVGAGLQASSALRDTASSQNPAPATPLHWERRGGFCKSMFLELLRIKAKTWWESSRDRTHFMKPAVSNPQASSKSAGPHRPVSVPVWMAAVLLPSVLWVLIYFHPLPYFMVVVDKINKSPFWKCHSLESTQLSTGAHCSLGLSTPWPRVA